MTTPASRTLTLFGGYLLVAGLALLFVPGLMLAPLGLPAPADAWGRVAGMVVTALGVYDVVAGRAGLMPLVRASVWVRAGVAAVLTALVVTGAAPAPLLLFGLVDALAALWTWRALQTGAEHPALHTA